MTDVPEFYLPPNGDWLAARACNNGDLSVFFPGVGESVSPARKICAGCPVTSECTATAVVSTTAIGIWGGMSGKDQKKLRRRVDIVRMCSGGCGQLTTQQFRGTPGRPPPHICEICELRNTI